MQQKLACILGGLDLCSQVVTVMCEIGQGISPVNNYKVKSYRDLIVESNTARRTNKA